MRNRPRQPDGLRAKLAFKLSDPFRVVFSHTLPHKSRWFGAPAAVARRTGSRSHSDALALTFGIDDPHLLSVLRLLLFNQPPARRKGVTLLFEFFGSDHTFGDLFGPVFSRPSVKQLTMPVYARIGTRKRDELHYGKPLLASVRATRIAGGPYVFDCHSEWRAWWDGIWTRCEASVCQDCGTYGIDGKWYNWGEFWGWKLCFCND